VRRVHHAQGETLKFGQKTIRFDRFAHSLFATARRGVLGGRGRTCRVFAQTRMLMRPPKRPLKPRLGQPHGMETREVRGSPPPAFTRTVPSLLQGKSAFTLTMAALVYTLDCMLFCKDSVSLSLSLSLSRCAYINVCICIHTCIRMYLLMLLLLLRKE